MESSGIISSREPIRSTISAFSREITTTIGSDGNCVQKEKVLSQQQRKVDRSLICQWPVGKQTNESFSTGVP